MQSPSLSRTFKSRAFVRLAFRLSDRGAHQEIHVSFILDSPPLLPTATF